MIPDLTTMERTVLQVLIPLCPAKKDAELRAYLAPLCRALLEYAIDTPERIAAFLAQITHESGGLRYWVEMWGAEPTKAQAHYDPASGSQLSKTLGNTSPGDGYRYRGRGPIQLTGRANYRKFGVKMGLDLEANPAQVSEPKVGFRVAGQYWVDKNLNELADENTENSFRTITLRINGGLNGWADRFERWHKAKKALGIE